MKTTTHNYCIYSDVTVNTHDADIRLYWTGSDWTEIDDDSMDYEDLDSTKQKAQIIKNSYPLAQVKILGIKSTSESEIIDIY
jgi:hypothetical protein